MAKTKRLGGQWLLNAAKALASELKRRQTGTSLRIRSPARVYAMDTDGWRAVLGRLSRGKNSPRLEIWLDRFTGHTNRKLWACFSSDSTRQLTEITKRVSNRLVPIRTIGDSDVSDKGVFRLKSSLRRDEFQSPILENYEWNGYFGIYDHVRNSTAEISDHWLASVAGFFESVARTLPGAGVEQELYDTYPTFENRQLVGIHLKRERSRLLSVRCKIRDDYECQVCGLDFEDVYGELGREFAESHHLVPLSKLRGRVRSSVDDLITVCANCHRMLHRMKGERQDVSNLRRIIQRRKQRHVRKTA